MRFLQVLLLFAAIALAGPVMAAPLVSDNFSGPVANANGQLPTSGSFPWLCSGPDFRKCIRGGGQLTATSGANIVYYLMPTSAKPQDVSYRFTDAQEPPNFQIAVQRVSNDFTNMWHVQGGNAGTSFVFNQSYWCDTVAGCPTPGGALPTSSVTNRGACAATVANRSYIGRVRFVGTLSLATLQDAATGDLLCLNLSTHPILQQVTGNGFYLETYGAAPNIAFTSVDANDTASGFFLPFLTSNARRNTLAVAAGLDSSTALGSGLLNSVFGRSSPNIEAAISELDGEIGSLSAGAGLAASKEFLNLLVTPLNNGRNGIADRRAGAMAISDRWNVWLSGYGEQGDSKADQAAGAHKEQQSQIGMAAGLDYRPVKGIALGGGIGQGRVFWGLPDFASSARANATQAGVYFSMHGTQRYLNLAGSYSSFSVRTNRNIAAIVTGQYEGHFHANTFGARLELGQHVLGDPAASPVSLFGAVEGQRFTAPAYTENTVAGPSTLALSYLQQGKNQVTSDLGLRVDTWSGYLTGMDLHASLAWRHLYTDSVQSAAAAFAGGSAFSVTGAPLGKDSALLTIGAEGAISSGLVLGLNVTGEASKARVAYRGNLGLRYGF